MPGAIKLSEFAVGASGVVCGMPATGTTFQRLREMGVLAGTTVKLVRIAPLGDPLEIKVRGYHLTLRKSEAEHILLERLDPPAADQGLKAEG
jgi:Fe2+ transport system protein FeoA